MTAPLWITFFPECGAIKKGETNDTLSFVVRSFASHLRLAGGYAAGCSHPTAVLMLQQTFGDIADVFAGEAVFGQDLAARCRGTEAIDANDGTLITDVALPSE